MNFGVCASSIDSAIDIANSEGISAMQIFTADPYKFSTSLNEVVEKQPAVLSNSQINFVAHGSLVTNLVSEKDSTRMFSINSLETEIRRCNVLNIEYIVAHPGSSSAENSIETLAKSLQILKSKVKSHNHKFIKNLCIENMVGSGTQLMSKPEHFVELKNLLGNYQEFGICLDTAHSWGAGYTPREFITALENSNIIDTLKVVHFNNSESAYGSNKERHAELSSGMIPEEEIFWTFDWLKEHPDIIVIEEQPKKSDVALTIKYLKEHFD